MIVHQVPHEFAIRGVFLPPLLLFACLGVVLALITGQLLNRVRLSQYISHPPVVLLSLAVIYTILIEFFFFGA